MSDNKKMVRTPPFHHNRQEDEAFSPQTGTAPTPVRIGLVGAGAWGQNLLRNIQQCESTELTAICDPDPAARRKVGSDHQQVRPYEEFDCLLADPSIEAVVIASPPGCHAQQTRKALESGRHVLVEKPMCMTSSEGRLLVELAKRRNQTLMVGHTFLYSNLVHEVKRRIVSSELGDVLYVHSQRLNLGRIRTDVDALWNFAPHDISIAAYWMDAWPRTVNARGASLIRKSATAADVAFFQLDFDDGRVLAGHVSWLDPLKVRRMVVVGTEKMLVYDDINALQHIQVYDKSVQLEFQSSASSFSEFTTRIRAGDLCVPTIGVVEPLGVEIFHFAECIRSGRPPKTDGIHGLRVVCVLEALSRSMAAGGRSIEVNESSLIGLCPPLSANDKQVPKKNLVFTAKNASRGGSETKPTTQEATT